MLKRVLFAYSRGIVSSRRIARAWEEHVIFMALWANTRGHFTTIAAFVSSLDDAALSLFREVLLVCDEQGLIGRDMLAVDGVKLPSNASKAWSGTRADFERRAKPMESALETLVRTHRRADSTKRSKRNDDDDPGMRQRDERFAEAKTHHKPNKALWGHKAYEGLGLLKPEDFAYDAREQPGQCPAGKSLHLNWVGEQGDFSVVRFKGRQSICGDCSVRPQCLRKPNKTQERTVTFFGERKKQDGPVAWMRKKIDSVLGRAE